MKAADRRPWTAGGRPGRGRARGAGQPQTGPERAGRGGAAGRGRRPWRGAGRRRVASRPEPAARGATRGRAGDDGRAAPRPPPAPPGDRGAGGGAKPTRGPRSGGHKVCSRPPNPPHMFMGGEAAAGGQDARPIRTGGPWHSHRPLAGGVIASLRAARHLPGDAGPSSEGHGRPGFTRGIGRGLVWPRQRSLWIPPAAQLLPLPRYVPWT